MVKRIYTHSSNPVHRVEQQVEQREMQTMMEKQQATEQLLATQQLSTVEKQPGLRGPSGDAPTAVASFVNVPGQLSPVSAGPCSTVQACAEDVLLGAAIVQSCVFDHRIIECMSAERPVVSRSTANSASNGHSLPQASPGNVNDLDPASRPRLPDTVPIITHDEMQAWATGEVVGVPNLSLMSRSFSQPLSATTTLSRASFDEQQVPTRKSAPSSSAPVPVAGRPLAPGSAGSAAKHNLDTRNVEVQTPRSLMEDAFSSSTAIGCEPSSAHEAFAGTVHVRVFRIMNFKHTAGWTDKTDPFVQLGLGKTMQTTTVKNNAGGAAVFDEVFSFFKDPSHTQLQVAVYDSDTLSNDLLGQTSIDLTRQPWMESVEELGGLKEGQSYDVFASKTGKVVQGQVFLAFAASVLIVKVHRISGFTDNAGWMDRTDPFVQLMYGKQKAKTKVKNNGGGNAEFNEVFFFDIIPADANGLEIAVLVCPLPRSHTDSV
jgi:hypothetical protein